MDKYKFKNNLMQLVKDIMSFMATGDIRMSAGGMESV